MDLRLVIFPFMVSPPPHDRRIFQVEEESQIERTVKLNNMGEATVIFTNEEMKKHKLVQVSFNFLFPVMVKSREIREQRRLLLCSVICITAFLTS